MLLSHYHLTLCLKDFSKHVKSDYTVEAGEKVPQKEAARAILYMYLPYTEVSLGIPNFCLDFISSKFLSTAIIASL